MKSIKNFALIILLIFTTFTLIGCKNQEKLNNAEPSQNQNNKEVPSNAVTPEPQNKPDSINNSEYQDKPDGVDEIGYISNFSVTDMNFDFDLIEWITLIDTDRIEELKLDIETQLTNGFYINNPETDTQKYNISDKTRYQIVDGSSGDNEVYIDVSLDDFLAHLNSFTDYSPLFWVMVDGNEVIIISEQYTP